MAPEPTREQRQPAKGNDPDKVFTYIRQALADLQFGTVTIVVQNGRVVQIERHEKHRMISNDPA